MKKIVFTFLFLFCLQVFSITGSGGDKLVFKKSDDLIPAPFEDFLFEARVDFLLSKMEDIIFSENESGKDLLFFEKSGSFLAQKYSLLNRPQRSRLFKCVLI
jgi:hypothetical protein